jgi:HEAT repeat protein
VEALGVLGDGRAIRPIAERLGDSLLGQCALEALVAIGTPEAARAIAAHAFAGRRLRAAPVDALSRIAAVEWPAALAGPIRRAVVAAFRAHYTPAHFDDLAELAKAGAAHSEAALEALGWSGDPRALPLLLVALGRPASELSAMGGLGELLARPDVAKGLSLYTDRLSAPARLDISRVLAPTSPLEAADLIVALLAHDDEVARAAADVALDVSTQLLDARPVDTSRADEVAARLVGTLVVAPASTVASLVRLAKGLVAGARLDPAAMVEVAERLMEREEPNIRLAGADLMLFARGLTSRVRDVLGSMLRQSDPATRLRALEIMAECQPDADSANALVGALGDEDPLVRRAAVLGLARLGDLDSVRALRSALSDRHALVAAEALAAVTAVEGSLAERALLEGAESDRAMVRCVAAERLAHLGTVGALQSALALATDDPESEVRRAAVSGFCGTGAPERLLAAESALADSHPAVRHAGLRLAAEVDPCSMVAEVVVLADTDESPEVRGEALVTLAVCAPDSAFERIGRAFEDPTLAPYVLRAVAKLDGSDAVRLRRFRETEAPPRLAFAIDILFGSDGSESLTTH